MEFVSDEHETIGGFSHSCRVANVRFEAGEESQRVLVVPTLEGCSGGSRSADNRPLYGRASADRRKFYRKSTDLGTLCGSGEEKGFADPTFLVGPADGFGFGEGAGIAPCAGPCGPCHSRRQKRGLKLGRGLSVSWTTLFLGKVGCRRAMGPSSRAGWC